MQRAGTRICRMRRCARSITAAPLRASIEQLANFPDALVIVAENDATRDEGENYARKLSDAGVRVTSVRYNGTIHDFVVLNALADTPARAARSRRSSARWVPRSADRYPASRQGGGARVRPSVQPT